MCQANFARNFDGRVFESVRIDQVTTLICRQSHTSMDFANSFALPYPTSCELGVANSLHYATASRPSTRTLWTMRMRGSQPGKIYFYFFRGLEMISKSGHKWLTPNHLIEFSGFSGISIDFPENQDVDEQELTAKFDRHFQLYLVCSPDLYS